MKQMTRNIFEPNGVDFVLGGHSHFYQHNLVNGIHHLIVGSAAAPLYNPTNASYTIKSVRDYSYAIFDPTPATMRVTVYNNRDVILDTLSFSKQTGVEEPGVRPSSSRLLQNFPNPFHSTTAIVYDLPVALHVTVSVLDVLGREVVTLVRGNRPAGRLGVEWSGAQHPSGVYFYRMAAREYTETRKLLLLR
jgi:hypothetical protein